MGTAGAECACLALQVIPLYDCGGSIPIGKQVDDFVCEDSDPRTQPGDCVIYQQGTGGSAKYNMCVKAQRRTVYTNTARVYQANFKVGLPMKARQPSLSLPDTTADSAGQLAAQRTAC
jgi:hypothetical protein